MKTSELAKKIRYIEIKSKKLVNEIFSGEYRSGFRGKGMEFENVRLYVPGDDVRNIDWNVTARQNKVYVEQFTEERELGIYLLIDMSRSNNFGAKKEIIAEISATLAMSANKNNDKVGVIFFTDKVEKLIPSKTGKRHVLSIIEKILTYEPQSSGTNIAEVLQYFNRIEKKPSVVILISDFLDSGYDKEQKITAKIHDLVRIRVVDKAEEYIPSGAIFSFKDLETGEMFVMDNTKRDLFLAPSDDGFKQSLISVYTDKDYVIPLRRFFKRRGAK